MDIAQIAQRRYTTKAFTPGRPLSAEQLAQLRALLRHAPSSVNSQPWHFVLAASEQGRQQVLQAMQGDFSYNAGKVRDASLVVVLCARRSLDDAHLQALLEQEQRDGRYATPEAMATQDKTRRFYVELHQKTLQDETVWISRQVYLALGTLLLGAATLGIDACPMEGFDQNVLDEELGLRARGFTSSVIVSLGYSSAEDFNAKLPKSRLPLETVLTRL